MAGRQQIVHSLGIVALCVLTGLLFEHGARAEGTCSNAPDDEVIIEYMNMLSFDDEISVTVIDKGTQFLVSLACPPPISPTMPPPDFYLRLISADRAQESTCESGTITLDKNQLKLKRVPFCTDGIVCSFVIELSNRETATIFSRTDYQITMTDGNSTLVPQLEPATLPVCTNTINSCLTTNACTLSSESLGSISLCDSQQCVSHPNVDGYSYNENVYFKVALR